MTLYKRDHFLFLFVFFSRNKAVRVDYFDFNVCLVMLFFFIIIVLEQCKTPATMFCGCNNILDIMVSIAPELSVDSVILTVCDESCSLADQNLIQIL